ncbi:MAG: class I SAM-dependent methyltransferase [Candidatus Omnitrophota bacterium]
MEMENLLGRLYRQRFSVREMTQKNEIWKVLCRSYFQKYISKDSSVLDLGAGFGEFINNIRCSEKCAVDINEDGRDYLNPEVKFYKRAASDLSFLGEASIDFVFISNVAEHLKTREDVIKAFEEIARVLRPEGRVMVMGPNVRYLSKIYWDFFDHYIPVSHKAVVELLQALGFKVEIALGKFLPFTTKSRIPKWPIAVNAYLRFPPIWRIMGRQMLVLAQKPKVPVKWR